MMVQAAKPGTVDRFLTLHRSERFAASSMASSSKISAVDDQAVRPCSIGCLWHKADMLNALANIRFWGQSGQ
jgi:hypothetical protein